MRFYYPSIFSLIFIAVLYVVALGAIWFVWTRIYKRKFSGSVAWSIVALVLVARKASYPQALMKPYRKGER